MEALAARPPRTALVCNALGKQARRHKAAKRAALDKECRRWDAKYKREQAARHREETIKSHGGTGRHAAFCDFESTEDWAYDADNIAFMDSYMALEGLSSPDWPHRQEKKWPEAQSPGQEMHQYMCSGCLYCNLHHTWWAPKSKKGGGCPYCAKKRLCYCRSLASASSRVVSEWDLSKNNNKCPSTVHLSSSKQFWWTCGICSLSYQASPARRIDNNQPSGCPDCTRDQVYDPQNFERACVY